MLYDMINLYESAEFDDDSAEMDNLQRLKANLEYFFMNPIKKCERKKTKPWKLLVQILKIFIFTAQLVLFGSDMAKFINHKDEMQVTFKQLFLKDWDPSADASVYPGPYVPYAVYTRTDFISVINYAVRAYSNVSNISVGPFGYQSNEPSVVSPIEICMTNYLRAEFEPTKFKYNYSMATETDCRVITNFAAAGSDRWSKFDIVTQLKKPINFSTFISSSLRLPLRTLLIEDAATGGTEIACFNVDVSIVFDNQHRDGQILINLYSRPRRVQCDGQLTASRSDRVWRRSLNIVVLIFCLLSFSLCARSLISAYRLHLFADKVLKAHGRTLIWKDRIEFLDSWLVLIIINDVLVFSATVIVSFYEERLLETDSYTTCSMLIGLGNFLSWVGLLRYLSFFKRYNILIVTMKKSFFHVLRFMLCTMLIYCGFCFCGWIVFGPYHFKFRQLSTTTECLFSLVNGDDMFETFALLRSEMGSIWWFSRIYLYVFVSLFIYVVLSLFIALIMDAYDTIKEYGSNGFPKTRLQSFYLDSDLTKLALASSTNSDSVGAATAVNS